MILIKLVDARKGLHEKCIELFHDEKVAESIYMYLCDGLEECDVIEPERKTGKWMLTESEAACFYRCDRCGRLVDFEEHFCPNCGARMEGLVDLQSAQPENIIQQFRDYQVEWLTSHCDLELEPTLEEWIVRFLNDTAECFELEGRING